MNPLLDFSGLPRFADVRPEHVAPAIRQLLDENRALLAQLERPETPASWDDFVQPMTDAGERLGRAWGVVSHLHGVNDVPEWRDAYNELLPEVTRFYAEIGQNLALYRKYKALAASAEYATLTATRRRIVDLEVRDFRLAGAELPDALKPRFQEIQEELSALGAKFSENLLDATNAHAEWVMDEAGLTGLPADVIAAAREAAEKDGTTSGNAGWKFSLHAPSYMPVMQYAEDRDLRARMYRAYATRAAEAGKPEWNNGPLIERILALRTEEAHMLGFANYAEYSLAAKMADSPAQVMNFLRDMAQKARPFAARDLAELREFAARELDMSALESWDMAWAAEKLKQARYAFSDDEVKQYFPEHKVLEGLFRCVQTLFGVEIKPDSATTWHPAVRFFRIERDGQLVGQFFLDLHARDTKRGGAWMADAIGRKRLLEDGRTDERVVGVDYCEQVARDGAPRGVQTPVAYLCCNFPAPVGEGTQMRPATFSHDDVLTLFHETGHGLHHLLTEVDDLAVSGIDGVEWDAVELPSQFMENFCWEWDVLKDMTAHVDTGEPLPRVLYDKMIAAKNFQSGMFTLRQVEFALFDLRLHAESRTDFMAVLDEVRKEVAVVFPPEWNRFPQSFGHIFAGGYAAGYYSYKWAEVLSADAYAAFEEAASQVGTVLDATTGEHFRREILAVGGSRPAIESFKAFRGRAPSPDALLRHNGMVAASVSAA